MILSDLYPRLKILRIRIEMSSLQSIRGDYYLGSTWRGILGWELRKLLYPYPHPPGCLECILQDSCPYFIQFEKQTNLPGILDAPRGYILYVPLSAADNKKLSLEFTLMGNCTRFVLAVLQSLAMGLGRIERTLDG